MSDSLNDTLIVSVLVLMISAKPELELLELEDEEPPKFAARLPAAPDELAPLDTVCPGVSLDRLAIMPLSGA
jgi:hypothetical protein